MFLICPIALTPNENRTQYGTFKWNKMLEIFWFKLLFYRFGKLKPKEISLRFYK